TFHASRRINQGEMIKTLASPDYMDTDPAVGTTLYGFMAGIAKYMDKYLNGYKDISHQGIGHYGQFSTGVTVPDLAWIMDGLGMGKGTWLAMNMFQYDEEKDEYTP